MRRSRRARWLAVGFKLAACALAGAVITVGVAMLLARVDRGTVTFKFTGRVEESAVRWPVVVPESWPRRSLQLRLVEALGFRQLWHQGFAPQWNGQTGAPGIYQVCVTDTGLPVASMRSLEQAEYLWSANGTLPLKWPEFRPWPLLPLWPGFALDTLFYGGLVFLLWTAPGVIRRRIRKRRGRCPACGYDLRGSPHGPCPECGT